MATWLKRFHLMMMIVWAGLAVPGIIFWRDSILFIIILSIYSYTSCCARMDPRRPTNRVLHD